MPNFFGTGSCPVRESFLFTSPIYLFLVYLFTCLLISLFTYLLVYLFKYLLISCLLIYLFTYLLVYLFKCLLISCLLIYLFTYFLFTYLLVYLFTYLLVYLFTQCPLCMEPFELDDVNFYPCGCGYQICRFCWHRIKTDESGLCPACRQVSYTPTQFMPLHT